MRFLVLGLRSGFGPDGGLSNARTMPTQWRRYFRKAKLPPAGVHVLRHTAAKLRRDVGETVEEVSRFLDHANLAVTTTYLRRLEGEEDKGWRKVAALLG